MSKGLKSPMNLPRGSEPRQVELANGIDVSDSRFDFTSLLELAVSPSEIEEDD